MTHDLDRHDDAGPGLGALAGVFLGAVGVGYLVARPAELRPADSAPGRTARRSHFGRYAIAGRTVTIGKPRDEIYRFWRHFDNLAGVMENVHHVVTRGDVTHWTLRGPGGQDVDVRTRIVSDRPGQEIAWTSTEDSQIETRGKIVFRDAPGNRGTEVTAIISYVPPFGALGRLIATLFQADPSIQGRRDLKRLKMFLETGEIATSRNRRQEG